MNTRKYWQEKKVSQGSQFNMCNDEGDNWGGASQNIWGWFYVFKMIKDISFSSYLFEYCPNSCTQTKSGSQPEVMEGK